MIARLRGFREDKESGITLAELLVAIIVLGILLTMVSSLFVSSAKVVAQSQATTQATGFASNAMNELSRVIRLGTPNTLPNASDPSPAIIAGTAESLTLYSYPDAYVTPSATCPAGSACATGVQPQTVQFTVNSSTRQVIEKRWKPTASSGDSFTFPLLTTTPSYNHIIGGPLLPTPAAAGSASLFTYLDADGDQVTPVAGGLSCSQRVSIVAVMITVRVQGYASSIRPAVFLQNTVQMPNLGSAAGLTC
jgi:type II secretory pathway pseudopilin PulG